ncbi:MAG: XrtA-associated tyrosine autokinase [Nitrospirota bacterium]
MSRIEKALEKAVQLRGTESEGGADEQAPVSKPAFKRERVVPLRELTVDSPYIITITEPASPIAEEYRKLKSLIVKQTKLGGFQNTIMVTSSLGWEGKSITALNLAVTLSQEYDHTVLLVDADLRKPSLHGYFKLMPEIGLADCLLDEAALGDALIQTGIGKLALLPAGKRVKDPVELLSSQKMNDLITEMKHRYSDRYIIIDTPPILPFAETHAISCMADGVVFVVKEGLATLQNINDALEILKESRMLGIVYNDAGALDLVNHYYAGHYYGSRATAKDGK